MKKIPTLFERDPLDRAHLTRQVNPDAAWVLAGEGRATRKFDGTCVLVVDGRMWKRYEVKRGRVAPADFWPADEVDPVTGKWQGWVAVTEDPVDQWHREAWWHEGGDQGLVADGTYELIGPRVQGNPEQVEQHMLVPHGDLELPDVPRTHDGLAEWLLAWPHEGVVWHHPDGRMAKIKRRDFVA